MSHFIDYCDEIRAARKNGFARVALPAAITLPDICARVEYPELSSNKKVGERYKKWIQTFLKGINPEEANCPCLNCEKRADSPIEFSCNGCTLQEKAYAEGIKQLAIQLYELRNNITHEGNIQIKYYLVDLAYSDAKFPMHMQPYSNGQYLYRKPLMNLGVLIDAFCLSAIRYYENTSDEKKEKLDDFDKGTFYSDNLEENS